MVLVGRQFLNIFGYIGNRGGRVIYCIDALVVGNWL